jgi:hypothetical protein
MADMRSSLPRSTSAAGPPALAPDAHALGDGSAGLLLHSQQVAASNATAVRQPAQGFASSGGAGGMQSGLRASSTTLRRGAGTFGGAGAPDAALASGTSAGWGMQQQSAAASTLSATLRGSAVSPMNSARSRDTRWK